MRATAQSDAEGRYQFRVGPGRYTVQGFGSQLRAQGGEAVTIEVKQEAEIVRDVTLEVPTPEKTFKGIVVEKTATGERPVAQARIVVWPLGSSGGWRTDDQGRFEFMRKTGELLLLAYSEEEGLASFSSVPADRDNATLIISKAATITGRIVDTDGKPRARNRVGIWLGPLDDYSSRLGVSFLCDEQGRFTFRGAPPRSHGEISAPHDRDGRGRTTRSRTVAPFEVPDLDPIEVPDLVVPVEKPAR